MATTLTRNLKLRVDSNLTANAKYNLSRLDLLGGTFVVDTTNSLLLRSQTDIQITPNSPELDGSGTGGIVQIGLPGQPVAQFIVYADDILLGEGLSLADQASGGNKNLQLQYKSDINGPVDTVANRNLLIDVDGADRNLVLAGNLSVLGGFGIAITATANSSVILPLSGTLSTLSGVETLTSKTINAPDNTLTNISNTNISNSAAIAYSKLNLSDAISNSDINSAAAIAYSKLSLVNSITNADISTSAAIPYSKLLLTNSVTNADIVSGASIAGSKINPDFGNQIIRTTDRLRFEEGGYSTDIRAAQSGQVVNWIMTLPDTAGVSGQVLSTNGAGVTSWVAVGGTGTVTSVDLSMPTEFTVSGNPITTAGTITVSANSQLQNLVYASPDGSNGIPSFRALSAADIPTLSTTNVTEGTNLYFTGERVDDRVAALIVAGTGISAVYSDASDTLTISSTVPAYTNEDAQDAVGSILTDTASVDLSYNDAGNTIFGNVIPGGVDHDQLLNFVANKHIDHTAVSISTAANSGLSGGGTIASSRSLVIDPTNAPVVTAATGDIVLIADVSNANTLSRTTVASIVALAAGSVAKAATDWVTGDGTVKIFTHSLGSLDVDVVIYDKTDGSTILVDSVVRTDTNTVTLTSSSAPGAAGFRVVVIG